MRWRSARAAPLRSAPLVDYQITELVGRSLRRAPYETSALLAAGFCVWLTVRTSVAVNLGQLGVPCSLTKARQPPVSYDADHEAQRCHAEASPLPCC